MEFHNIPLSLTRRINFLFYYILREAASDEEQEKKIAFFRPRFMVKKDHKNVTTTEPSQTICLIGHQHFILPPAENVEKRYCMGGKNEKT